MIILQINTSLSFNLLISQDMHTTIYYTEETRIYIKYFLIYRIDKLIVIIL